MNQVSIARFALSILLATAMLIACVTTGETGDALVTFNAYASGPRGANGGTACGDAGTNTKPLVFSAPNGFQVTLQEATMTIGAVYLIEGQLAGGSVDTSCILNGTYCGQVPGGVGAGVRPLGLNLLCPDPTEFSVHGNGTANVAGVGELWLTGGLHSCLEEEGGFSCSAVGPDVNAQEDPTPIVQLQGVATNGTVSYSFLATVTIQQSNRGLTSMAGLPGNNPICEQRILKVYPLALQLYQGGSLYVTVDPSLWFSGVDFTQPTCGGPSSSSGSGDGGKAEGGAPDGGAGEASAESGAPVGSVCPGLQYVSGTGASTIWEIPDSNSSTIGLGLYEGIVGGAGGGAKPYSFVFANTPPSP